MINQCHFLRHNIYGCHRMMLCQKSGDRKSNITSTSYSNFVFFHMFLFYNLSNSSNREFLDLNSGTIFFINATDSTIFTSLANRSKWSYSSLMAI